MCTWTVIEVVNYFVNRGTTVYACLLDYRKAFDYCNHVIMFKNLLNRKVNRVFIRVMIDMYLNQSCYIKWQESRSLAFSVTNGTRQGDVFSPRGGFTTYLDPLLFSLRSSGLGCRIGGHWLGGLALADDVILLSPSVQGLQELVSICEKHAKATDQIRRILRSLKLCVLPLELRRMMLDLLQSNSMRMFFLGKKELTI